MGLRERLGLAARQIDCEAAEVAAFVDRSLFPVYAHELREQFPAAAPTAFAEKQLAEIDGIMSPPLAHLTVQGWLSLRRYRRLAA